MFSSIICIVLLTIGFHFTNELRLELSLRDVSGAKTTAKISCQPVNEKLRDLRDEKQQVLWEGSKFGIADRDFLRGKLPGHFLVPDVRVRSSKHYRCVMLAAPPEFDKRSLRKRIHRALSASIPAEKGSCKPGYRLEQDRCFPCAPGSYTSGQDSRCLLCPKDFYSSIEAADSCTKCPDGSTTDGMGADSESKCLDSKGQPVSSSKTKWMVVGICFLILIVTMCIVVAVLWWYYNFFKKMDKRDLKHRNFIQRFLEVEKGNHIYDPVSKYSAEDHIYEEVDEYEIPIKRKKSDHHYYDLTPSAHDHIYDEVAGEDTYEAPKRKTDKNKKGSIEGLPMAPPPPGQKSPQKGARKAPESPGKPKIVRKAPAPPGKQKDKPKRPESPKPKRKDNQPQRKAPNTPPAKQGKRKDKQVFNVSLHDDRVVHSLPRYSSHGFQPVLASSKPSDCDQLGAVFQTSKSQVPSKSRSINFEEMGMDVEELSKFIGRVPEKNGEKDSSNEKVRVRKVKSEDYRKNRKREKAHWKKSSRKNKPIGKTAKIPTTSTETEEYLTDIHSIPSSSSETQVPQNMSNN